GRAKMEHGIVDIKKIKLSDYRVKDGFAVVNVWIDEDDFLHIPRSGEFCLELSWRPTFLVRDED
ncbi:unnamed protein product, partial [marine sediment metagenome]